MRQRKDLGRRSNKGEPRQGLLWLPRKVIGKDCAKAGLLLAHLEVRES